MAPKRRAASSQPKAVSRPTTPSEGEWNTRLRSSVRPQTPSVAGTPDPDLNTPAVAQATPSRATPGPSTGVRDARVGTGSHSYGIGTAATTSRMALSRKQMTFTTALQQQLGEQNVSTTPRRAAAVAAKRAADTAADIQDRSKPLADDLVATPSHFDTSDAESEVETEPATSKSYGSRHEGGIIRSRFPDLNASDVSKSYGSTHEGGIIRSRFSKLGSSKSTKSYGSTHEGGIIRRQQPLGNREPRQSTKTAPTVSPLVVFWRWIANHKLSLAGFALMALICGILYLSLPAIKSYISSRLSIPDANATITVTSRPSPVTIRQPPVTVHHTTTVKASAIDAKLLARIQALESQVKGLQRSSKGPIPIQRVNHFSPHIGAQVDQSLTSPTMTTGNTLRAHVYKAFFFSPGNLPAVTALMPWSEAGQCWCAARNRNGLAQLGVTTQHTIRADAVTIEHAAQGTTLDIKSAPEWVEVWGQAEMGNFDVPEAVGCTTEAPAPGWVCLGRTRYDINTVSNIQTAELAVKVVPARRFVVRVTSNHGRDYTCLYRVQVHGEVVE